MIKVVVVWWWGVNTTRKVVVVWWTCAARSSARWGRSGVVGCQQRVCTLPGIVLRKRAMRAQSHVCRHYQRRGLTLGIGPFFTGGDIWTRTVGLKS